jgi:hypothetical protein
MPTLGSRRLPVILSPEENQLFFKLKITLETEFNKQLSIADVVRLALRKLAEAKGLSVVGPLI